ncbi:MAG TPA: hypothetical protein PKY49_06740, partial [Anaerolineae bacterium]|nr:hypothetical protein [Anaerolineae bacterium]
KGSSIAIKLPDARLNYDRIFSFLNDARQHMASPPLKIGEKARERPFGFALSIQRLGLQSKQGYRI